MIATLHAQIIVHYDSGSRGRPYRLVMGTTCAGLRIADNRQIGTRPTLATKDLFQPDPLVACNQLRRRNQMWPLTVWIGPRISFPLTVDSKAAAVAALL